MTKLSNKVKAIVISVLAALAIALGMFAFLLMPGAKAQSVSAAGEEVTVTLEAGQAKYSTATTTSVSILVKVHKSAGVSKKIGAVSGNIQYDSNVFSITSTDFVPYTKWSTDSAITPKAGGVVLFSAAATNAAGDITDSDFTAMTLNFTVNRSNVQPQSYTFSIIQDKKFEVTNIGNSDDFTAAKVDGTVLFATPSDNTSLSDFKVGTTNLGSSKISGNTIDGTSVTLPYPSSSVSLTGFSDYNAKINTKASGTAFTVSPTWANAKATTGTATVTVVAEDGTHTQTYTVNLKRAAPDATVTGKFNLKDGNGGDHKAEPISDTSVGKISFAAWNGKDMTFTCSGNGTGSSATAKITAGPEKIGTTVTDNNGKQRFTQAGRYTVEVTITAQSTDFHKYTITFELEAGSSDNALNSVTLTADGATPLTANASNEFTVHIRYADKDKRWTLSPDHTGKSTTCPATVGPFSADGNYPQDFTVTSEGGAVANYRVTVVVDKEVTDDTLDMTTSLMIGGLNGTSLALNYNSTTGKYEPTRSLTAAEVEDLYIVAEATNAASTVDFSGSSVDENDKHLGRKSTAKLNLTNGANNITITVSAENGNTKDYPVSIYYNAENGNPYITSITLTYGSKSKTVARQNMMFHVYGIPKNVSELKFSSITNYEVESVKIYITDVAGSEIQTAYDPRQGTMGAGVNIKIRDESGNYYSIELTVKSGEKSATFYVDFLDSKPGEGSTAFSMTGDSAAVSLNSDEFSNGRAYVASFSSNKDTYDFEIFLPEGYSFRVTYGNLLKKDNSTEAYEVGEYVTEGGTYKIGSGLDKYVIEVVNEAGEVKTIVLTNEKSGGINVGMLVAIIILAILFVAATVIMAVYIGKYINASKKEENSNPGYRD